MGQKNRQILPVFFRKQFSSQKVLRTATVSFVEGGGMSSQEGLLSSCMGGLYDHIRGHRVLLRIVEHIRQVPGDGAHDLSHIARVLSNAWQIGRCEGGDPDVIVAAVLLHDIKNLPKGHPQAKASSSLSARYAGNLLSDLGFSPEKIANVQDAIVCHSFSKGLKPKTLEGKILQDADRLDALGAIGVARTFYIAGTHGASLYEPKDPLGRSGRPLDDVRYSTDHFLIKIFRLPDLMQTETGKLMAQERLTVVKQFLDILEREVDPPTERFLRE